MKNMMSVRAEAMVNIHTIQQKRYMPPTFFTDPLLRFSVPSNLNPYMGFTSINVD